MNLIKRVIYPSLVISIRAYERLFFDKQVWGRENIPPGPKIYVVNHISSHDAFHIMPVFTEPVHYIIGPGYESPLTARLLDALEHINAMPGHGKTAVTEAVRYLNRGEPVVIAPEGDIQEPFKLGRFMPGVARIYRRARVPLVPMALVAPKRYMRASPKKNTVVDGHIYRMIRVTRGAYCVNVGKPWMPDSPPGSEARQIVYIASGLRDRLEALVEDVRRNKFWL